MSFDWADDTEEAVATGELPDFTTCNTMFTNFLSEIAEIHIGISEMVGCGKSLLRCLFYKKWGIYGIGRETAARDTNKGCDIWEAKEKLEAKLWPGGGRWRVKKRSPLRVVTFA